jgi:prophage regulatory protein
MHPNECPQLTAPDRCLRWPQVQPMVGVSRTTWWRLVKSGEAPAPVKISANCIGWMENSIREFQGSRVRAAVAG